MNNTEFQKQHEKPKMKTIYIGDGNEQSWNSGLADYLMKHFKYVNTKYGFKAYVPENFVWKGNVK